MIMGLFNRNIMGKLLKAVGDYLIPWLKKWLEKEQEKYEPCEVCGSKDHRTKDHPPDPIEFYPPEGPVYDGAALTEGHPGFILATENYVAGYINGRDKGAGLSFVHVKFVNPSTGQVMLVDYKHLEPRNTQKSPDQPYCVGPNGATNWTDNGDHPGEKKPYLYITRVAAKEAGTDGTMRGLIWVPMPHSGSWNVYVKYRATNHRGTGYVGLITKAGEQLHVKLWRWNQRGDTGAYPEIQLGSNPVIFNGSQS